MVAGSDGETEAAQPVKIRGKSSRPKIRLNWFFSIRLEMGRTSDRGKKNLENQGSYTGTGHRKAGKRPPSHALCKGLVSPTTGLLHHIGKVRSPKSSSRHIIRLSWKRPKAPRICGARKVAAFHIGWQGLTRKGGESRLSLIFDRSSTLCPESLKQLKNDILCKLLAVMVLFCC